MSLPIAPPVTSWGAQTTAVPVAPTVAACAASHQASCRAPSSAVPIAITYKPLPPPPPGLLALPLPPLPKPTTNSAENIFVNDVVLPPPRLRDCLCPHPRWCPGQQRYKKGPDPAKTHPIHTTSRFLPSIIFNTYMIVAIFALQFILTVGSHICGIRITYVTPDAASLTI
ncbi:hypothetical protein B0H14DRAFT_3500038 [Mycena olivaceomarginata]|nr:hypothetical protein B0H14DRAFT_3500038 [Mycena olivaceomarginata]